MRIDGRAIQLPTRGKDGAQPNAPLRPPFSPAEGPGPLDPATSPGETFTSVVTAFRWATTAGSLLQLTTGPRTRADALTGAAVLTYALWRTIWPIPISRGGRTTLPAIFFEATIMVGAVLATGYWSSFFSLGLLTAVCVAGLAYGVALSFPVAAVCIVVVAVPYHVSAGSHADFQLTSQWAGELALVALVTGYARRLTLAASAETSAFMGRLHQLSEANTLLLQLHHVTTTLPMSLDLDETLESSAARLRELFEPDVLVILVRDEHRGWRTVKASGARMPATQAEEDLPPILRESCASRAPRLVNLLEGGRAQGLDPASSSGLYAPLFARQELVGLVALERHPERAFAESQVSLIEAFVEQMAVAIDNAHWFARIGTLAVEQERTRIARDLHDRVGQSLALVGFELDRAGKSRTEEDLRRQVGELRETVRSVVAELRETLYDLRTDVTEEHDLGDVLSQYLDRVQRRTGLHVTLEVEAPHRWPLAVEREVWHVAQEAVTNAERHARAQALDVRWHTEDTGASLVVRDDGAGMPETRRPDGYGLVGMRERADAIGANLSITSAPGHGTEIRLDLKR